MTIKIHGIPTFTDNYVWALIQPEQQSAIVVDPGESEPVLDYLAQNDLTLAAILITHHHGDHTNGIPGLLAHYAVPVFAGQQCQNPHITQRLNEGDKVNIKGFPAFHVINIPGHTKDHVAYYANPELFCGDTLFAAGCGRLFEGSAADLHTSLQKLKSLGEDTLIYCGHEYTLNNLRFAQAVEPHNPFITERLHHVEALRKQSLPTLPSTMRDENLTNPFLRCDDKKVKSHLETRLEITLATPLEVFTALRQWKDNYRYE